MNLKTFGLSMVLALISIALLYPAANCVHLCGMKAHIAGYTFAAVAVIALVASVEHRD